MVTDEEWEAADPNRRRKRRPFRARPHWKWGRMSGRHYVPQWKVDEEEQEKHKADEARAAQRAVAAAAKAAHAELLKQKKIVEEKQAEIDRLRLAREQQAREQQARKPVERNIDPVEVEATKKAIMSLIRTSYPLIWTPERLTSALGLAPEKVWFITFCAEQMVRAKQITTAKVSA
jgi:multidrug efflux pump subunit AcrA (membrane-fusion protein)